MAWKVLSILKDVPGFRALQPASWAWRSIISVAKTRLLQGPTLAFCLPAVGLAHWAVAAQDTVVGHLAKESPCGGVPGRVAL